MHHPQCCSNRSHVGYLCLDSTLAPSGFAGMTASATVCPCFPQVPQRLVCTGFSNGGAYAELCGIWAAIQWPAAPVRVIVWGAPVVSICCSGVEIHGVTEFPLSDEGSAGLQCALHEDQC